MSTREQRSSKFNNIYLRYFVVLGFVRPNTISAERKARMKKTKEYGGICVTTLDDQVTHIVVDKDLQYKDISTLLNINELRVRFSAHLGYDPQAFD